MVEDWGILLKWPNTSGFENQIIQMSYKVGPYDRYKWGVMGPL